MKRLTCIGLVFLLAGCAMNVARVDGPANMQVFSERREQLQALATFSLRGRVGISTVDDGWSGGLNWTQHGDQLEFSFRGPLGAGGIEVTGDADEMRVKTSRGEDFITRESELDFTDELGWKLPVRSMRYWVLGVPDPGRNVTHQDIDAMGFLHTMNQDGWQVEVTDYMAVDKPSGEVFLPRRMLISNTDLRIKLAIRGWNLDFASD